MRETVGKCLAFLGCGALALIVTFVLSGVGQSGVVGMEMTHVLFWLAFGTSVICATLGTWFLSNSWKNVLLALACTVLFVGAGLFYLGDWLHKKKAEQEALNKPPAAIPTVALKPKVPIVHTPKPKPVVSKPVKIEQHGSENTAVGGDVKPTGDCNVTIVGGSHNRVSGGNCIPTTIPEPTPPVFVHLGGKNNWFTNSYVAGGALETDPNSEGLLVQNNTIDAAPWFKHQERMKELELSDATKPRFVATVGKAYFMRSSFGASDIFAYVEVTNKGQPSAIKNWRLDYQLEGEDGSVDAAPVLLDATIHDPNGKPLTVVSVLQSTPEITSGKELLKDATAQGWIQAHIPAKHADDFQRTMKNVVLVCHDNLGTEYVLRYAQPAKMDGVQLKPF